MGRGTRTLACRAAGLSGVGNSLLPLHGASVAVAADENAYRSAFVYNAAMRPEMFPRKPLPKDSQPAPAAPGVGAGKAAPKGERATGTHP
jgi:hypothetical protein